MSSEAQHLKLHDVPWDGKNLERAKLIQFDHYLEDYQTIKRNRPNDRQYHHEICGTPYIKAEKMIAQIGTNMEDKQAEETGFNLALAYFASNILELDDYATELQDFLVDSAFPMQVTSWYQAYVTFNENKLSATAVPVGKAYDRSDAESSETQQTVVSMKIENDNKMEELHDKVRSAANEQNASLKGDDYDPDNVRSHFREMFQSAVKLHNDPKDPSQPAFFLATARLMCEINHLDSELEELKEHMESVNEEVTDMFNDFLVRYNLSCEDLVEEASPAVEPGEATWNIGHLIPLAEKGSDARNFFHGPKPAFVHIQKEDGTILPATKGKNFKGVSLKVRLTGGGQCPKLVVEATHEKPGKLTRQPNHRAELVFNLGTTSDHEHSQITDIHVIEEAGITFSETKKEDKPQDNDGGNASDREKRYLRIQFKTRGGLGFNLDRQDPAFDPETVQTLAFLQDHEYRKLNENPLSTSPCVRTVHLVVEMSAMHRQTPDFLKYLNNFTVPLSFPWQAYRHQKGGLNIQIGQMFSRDMVSQNWSVLPKSDPILVVSPQGDPVAIFNARDEAHAEDVKEEVHVEDEAQVEVEGLVHPNTVVGIPEIPAKAYFVDAIEGATALGYGIAIDQRLADINYERLQHTPHKVAFTPVGSAVQAHLIFRHLFEEGARPRLPEGTFVKIVFRIQGEEKTQKVTAFTISSALGQARGNVLLLVIGRPLMYFTENGLASTDDTKWIECNLQVRSDMGALKRMVSSLEEFKRNDVAKKFLPVFLNQRPRDLPPTCPFEDLDKDLITRKKNAILGRQNVNDEQRRAFNQLFQMHGHFALCQGIPGSGKTRQIAMMIAFVLSLGLPVLACASTNQATDHLAEVVAKYLKDSGDAALKAIKPVRVYRPMQERNAADKTTSKEDAGEEAAEDDDDIAEMDADHILYNVLSQLKADVSRKNFNHAAFSLQARTNEYATEAEGREQLWSNYKGFPDRDPEVRLYNADTGAVEKSIESGDREGSEMLDMLEVIRDSTARLQGEPLEKWAKDDQNKRRRALNVGGHHVIGKAQLVFSTTNGVAGPFIKEKFGEKAQGIFVFVDEASQDPEPNTWTFLKLAQLEKVKGIYLVGDQEQLKPAVFSATASPRINEFAPQLTMSLFTRLITSGFPSCKLFTQFRAHPDLMHYPNMRTYNNTVTNGPGAKGLILDRQWQKSTREFLSVPQRMLTVFVIDVTDSFCEKYPGTKTRYNPNHVNVGVAYIKKLYEDGCLEKHSMLIVTPYQGQRSRYTEQLARLSMDKGIPMSRLPTVHTARTMQGREADVIIYDSVLSSVESIAELGIQRDEGLMNVAHTRARRGFVGICSDQITRGTLSDKWPAKKDLEGRGSKVHNPKPYLIDMVNYYARQGKLFHLAGQNYAIEN